MVKTITNVIPWLKSWFYTKEEINTGVIENTQRYDNIKSGESTTLTLTDQEAINSAINTKLGELASIAGVEIVKVVSSKGTAGADTMNKLFIVSENNKVNVYYTKATTSGGNTTYEWQKMDTDILDELNIDWDDVQNNPFSSSTPSSFATSSHVHGYISNDGKYTGSTTGTPFTSYNRPLVIDTNNSNKIILGGISSDHIFSLTQFFNNIDTSNYGSTIPQHYVNILLDAELGNKQDEVTSISLVPKGNDTTADAYDGVIKIYTGDEPSGS